MASQLESIINGVQSRMAERQQAIQYGNIAAEWRSNQQICRGLQDAANVCPRGAPAAKEGFQTMANLYHNSTSRYERDNLIMHFAKRVLSMGSVASILAGAGTLTVNALSASGIMCSLDGSWQSNQDTFEEDESGSAISSELFELLEDPF